MYTSKRRAAVILSATVAAGRAREKERYII